MRVLAEALRDSDTLAIRERMDAERVRQSLRDGYVARLGRDPTDADRSAAAIASLALFSRGLEMVMATVSESEEPRAELTDWVYASSARVRTTLRQGDSPPLFLVLERKRTTWQLVAIDPSEPAWRELELGYTRSAR